MNYGIDLVISQTYIKKTKTETKQQQLNLELTIILYLFPTDIFNFTISRNTYKLKKSHQLDFSKQVNESLPLEKYCSILKFGGK